MENNIKAIASFIVNFGFMAFPDKEKTKAILYKPSTRRGTRSWRIKLNRIMDMIVC
jgi:hypothetical protein